MRDISSWSIKNPIPVIMLFIMLTLGGVAGFNAMRINNNPDIDFPLIYVNASRPGAAPTEMETQVTRLIEDKIAGLSGVRHMRSTVQDGVSVTVIEFELSTDVERATNDVRNAMGGLMGSLPQDMQEPIVQRIDITGDPLITWVVRSGSMTPEQLSWFVDNEVSRALLAIQGVGEVTRLGGVDREIRIDLDPDRLASFGVTAATVSQALVNVNNDMPGGRVTVNGSERSIRTLGSAGSVQELADMRVPVGGASVRLGDLGRIEDSWTEPRSRARYDGQEVITFNFLRSREASEVRTAERVRAEIARIDAAHPELQIEQINAYVEFAEESYIASLESVGLGALLAVIVVWLFLRDWRATLIAAVAMPLSLIPTFAVLEPMGQSLNMITLLALSLTIGILVDDAIVEIENIVRHMRGGKAPYPAAMEAADEIGLAVVATTLTIVAVFAPVGFMPGIIGQFFKAFALAACVSVLFSLVVARTLTPLMGAYLLKHKPHEDADPPWMTWYLGLLSWALKNRWKVFAMGAVVFVLTGALTPLVPVEVQPAVDYSRAAFSVELPPGSTLDQTDDVVARVTRELRKRPEVTNVYASIGGNDVNTATVTAELVDKGERDLTQQQFVREMVDALVTVPGARIGVPSQIGGGPTDGSVYSYSIQSDDGDTLMAAAQAIEREMRSVRGLANVLNTAAIARPEILITPRADEAARLGVSAGVLSQAIRVATIGDIDQLLPKYNLGDRQVPIRLRLSDAARQDITVLENLRVPTVSGGSVPLSAVASVTYGAGPSQVSRLDRSRVATITTELNGITSGEASQAVNQLPSVKNLPEGVKQGMTGDIEFIREMIVGFAGAFITGLLLMYAVLALLFKSFTHPVTIMAALPLAIGGAFVGLLIMGSTFSIASLIGILMLMGIAAKNSILLVEYALEAIKHGMGRYEALMDAAHKRARPILMTTVAMGAGMAPTALGWGADVEFRQPMAVAVVGGLITSTLLSLLYIPAIFTIVDDVRGWGHRRLERMFAGQKVLKSSAKPLADEAAPEGAG
ncbi:MAG: efflux RND transporter permease subunit [Caulobacterales bacterium]|nr:efflux RND transporter permease subunit [Caulobacterales bacterium]